MSLIPLQQDEITIGMPLIWHVTDGDGKVLFERGRIIDNPQVLTQLLKLGLYRIAPERPDESAEGRQNERGTSSLKKFHLAPGDSVQLQPLQKGDNKRFQVKVIGCYAPVSVLVTAPAHAGKLAFVREGQPFLVRGFVGKDAVAYKTKVLKSNLAPFAYLHLAYPDSVQSMRIRNSARVALELITSISRNGGKVTSATMVDLSLGGARIMSVTSFGTVGDEVELAFRINPAGLDVYLKLNARIRIVNEDDPDGQVSTGLEFVNLSEQDRLYLSSMVYQNLVNDEM